MNCFAVWRTADSVASCFPRCTCLLENWHKCTMLPRCGRLRLFRFIPPSSHHRPRHTSCNLPRCLRTVLVTMPRATSTAATQTPNKPPNARRTGMLKYIWPAAHASSWSRRTSHGALQDGTYQTGKLFQLRVTVQARAVLLQKNPATERDAETFVRSSHGVATKTMTARASKIRRE